VPYAENLERIGYHDLGGRAAFKLAIEESDGRFFLYAASFWDPGFFVVDVTDAEHPELVRFVPGPPHTWTLQVQAADGRLITGLERIPGGWGDNEGQPQAGFVIWDLTDPSDPRRLGSWEPGGSGTHRNFYDGGRYVHAAANLPGYVGRGYVAVDIDDPEHPQIAGQWWYPGQHEAAGEVFSPEAQHKRLSGSVPSPSPIGLHGGAYRAGNRLYCPWARGGLVTLDISDIAHPREVSTLSVYPPLGSANALHTAVPLPDRDLVVINDEALNERRAEPLNYAAIVDFSQEEDPMFLSMFPQPRVPAGAGRDFFLRGGRFGPHNQHQPQGHPALQPSGDLIYLTYFNAGLQVFDISDARSPRIVASYIPDDPTVRRGPQPTDLVVQVEDVLVDRRGNIFISEKNSGITVLRHT